MLWIFEDGRPFVADEIGCARLIAAHADLALTNAERYHRAKERAFIDDVTEVYNARFLRQAIEHEIQRAERYGKQLCVLFLDLDRFKLVNDQHGHLVGSQVLRRLSRGARSSASARSTRSRATAATSSRSCCVDTGIEEGARRRRAHPPHGRGHARSRAAAARRSGSRSASASPPIRPTAASTKPCSTSPTRPCTAPSRWAGTASARPPSSGGLSAAAAFDSARRIALSNLAISFRFPSGCEVTRRRAAGFPPASTRWAVCAARMRAAR